MRTSTTASPSRQVTRAVPVRSASKLLESVKRSGPAAPVGEHGPIVVESFPRAPTGT